MNRNIGVVAEVIQSRAKPHILLIDDDEGFSTSIEKLLSSRGYAVETAPNGRVGLDLLEQEAFDLALVDIYMPEVDGLEVILKLRRRAPGTRVVAVSGGGRPGSPGDVLNMALALGSVRVISKPFEIQELLSLLEEVLSINPSSNASGPGGSS